jgi:uncharacterized membrane protein
MVVVRTTPIVSVTGLVLAWLGYLVSLTPTMVPRTTPVQLLMSIVLPLTGYALGAGLGALGRLVVGDRELLQRHTVARRAALTLGAVAIAVALAATPVALRWQTELAEAAGWSVPSWPLVFLLALPAVALLVLGGRLLRLAGRRLGRQWQRVVPWHTAASVLGGLSVVAILAALITGAFLLLERQFVLQDADTTGQAPPTTALRSGGPGSLVEWETLGRQGRAFVGSGPSAEIISGFSGRPASEPIRVYVGMEQAQDAEDRAALLVEEMRRAGGFERSALVVVVTSGLGAVHPVSAQTAEYVANGDIATAATQYSAVPSWMTAILDRDGAQREAEALVAAFTEAVSGLGEDERPLLYLNGESLGASGSQNVFVGQTPEQVVSEFDGVLWVGTPATSTLKQQWAEHPEGAPAWEPVVGDGSIARFAANPDRVPIVEPSWGPRRILFLHSATDPVAYFSGSLLRARPDWIGDGRFPSLPERMAWWPLFTWEQMLIDFTTNGIVPPGFGHNYSDSHADGWAAVMHPDGWDRETVERLEAYRAMVGPPDPGAPANVTDG